MGIGLALGRAAVSGAVQSAKGPSEVAALLERAAIVFLVSYIALLALAGFAQLREPFFHYDDAPALFALAEDYHHKAVTEGRWFNYLWHLREFRLSAAGNFQLYLVGWAIFIAAISANFFRTGGLGSPIAFALLVVLGPQTTEIAGWYNSLIPGVWLLALFAGLALVVSETRGRLLMAAFVPVSLQAYTPYPFLLLTVSLLRGDRPSDMRHPLKIFILFAVMLVLGVLAVQALNFLLAGDFGVEPHTWRNPTPAEDLAGLVANVPKAMASFADLYRATGFGSPAVSGLIAVVFGASFLVLLRASPQDALSIALVIGSGLGMLTLYTLWKGIEFPYRATSFVWIAIALTIVRAASLSRAASPTLGALALAPALAVGLALTPFVLSDFRAKSAWQDDVRAMLEQVPEGAAHIYVYGDPGAVRRSPKAFSELDLTMHLLFMSGIETTDCAYFPEKCTGFGKPFEGVPPGPLPIVKMQGDAALLLPPAGAGGD